MTDSYPSPLDDAALVATWDAAWSSLGRPAPTDLQAELMTAWSEPHRHYHDHRPRLYHGEYAGALLEAQARIKLAAALSRLAQ